VEYRSDRLVDLALRFQRAVQDPHDQRGIAFPQRTDDTRILGAQRRQQRRCVGLRLFSSS